MSREPEDESAEDREFARSAGAELRRRAREAAPRLRERLDRMVDTALRSRAERPRRLAWIAWPIGAATASVVIAALLIFNRGEPPAAPPANAAADDLALLLNVDNLDLLEQMEFYQWLERQPGLLEGGAEPPGQRS